MTDWNGQIHPAADIFPMVAGEEFDDLVASIRTKGLVEDGWLLPDGTLLDGRNRRAACEQAGVPMRWQTYRGADPIGFVVAKNIERRHLTTGQKAGLACQLLPLFEQEALERKAEAGKAAAPGRPAAPEKEWADLPTLSEPNRARDKAAKTAGTSGRAVAQFKRVATTAPDLAEKVMDGALTLDNAEKQAKRRVAQHEEQQAREIKLVDVMVDAAGQNWRLLHGDFRERLLELPAGSVDLIVTDPPYPAEFLPLYGDLGRIARHVLADDGICLVLTGQIFLDRVLDLLGEHLNYGWVYVQPQPGANSRILGRHVLQCWKPWLAFSKGAWPSGRIGWHPDMLDPSYRMKDQYRWQQQPDYAVQLVDALCPQGGTVCDPFTGTGSYGVAALTTGRRFLGTEMDGGRFERAKENLGAAACSQQ